MKKIYALCILVMLCTTSFDLMAIEDAAPTGEISGKVIDKNSKEPVSFASVAVFAITDSAVVTGAITNDAGEFQIQDIPLGSYRLKVSFLGYETQIIEPIKLDRKSRTFKVESLPLSPTTESMEEVTVTRERLKGEEKIDRTVFTINDDIRSASTSGIDVLKHIPSVTVDFQENVMIEGQSDFQFYVDGVLRNKEFVAQLNPKDIDKIELITNPGVKYDSDISAIINIVMSKTRKAGVNGSILVPGTHPDKAIMNPKANIEYGNQNFRIYIGDRMHYERFKGTESLYTKLDESNPNPYEYKKIGTGYNSWQNNYLNYGIDWFISDKSSLNFLGEWERHLGYSDDYLSSGIKTVNGEITEYVETFKDSRNPNNNYFFSTFFKQQLAKEGNEITIELNYFNQVGSDKNEYEDIYYDPENTDLVLKRITRSDLTENQRNNLAGKLDYTFTWKDTKHETGIKIDEIWMDNDFISEFSFEGPSEVTQEFSYVESRRAGYYNVTGNLGKINWQIGARGEYSNTELSDTLSVDYLKVLPQLSLSRSFDKGQTLKLSFRRKLLRPYTQDLNPFETWTDSLHLRVGNPELDPAIENRVEFSYSKNFGNNYISPKLYFRYTQDGIQDLTVIEDGVSVISRANIGEEMEYGLNVNAAFQFFDIWRINVYGAVFNRTVDSNHDLSLSEGNQRVSFRGGGSTMVQLPKGFTVFAFTNYNGPNINYQRIFYRDFLYLFGMEKEFSEKAKISVVYNPFIKDFTYTRVETESPGYYENWEGSVAVQHLFSIEFVYNFSYGGKVNKINRQVEYEKGSSGGTF